MSDLAPPPNSSWFTVLWSVISLLGGLFIHDLRAKLRNKIGRVEFDALGNAFRAEMLKDRESFREALRTDRETCEAARNRSEVQISDHEGRLRDLETYRAAVTALSTNVGNLGSQVEHLANISDEHHKQNRIDAAEDRKGTENWRANVMAPLLKQLGEQSASHSEAINALKAKDDDKESRLRDLERSPRSRAKR